MSFEMPMPPDRKVWMGQTIETRLQWRKSMFIPHPDAKRSVQAVMERISLTAMKEESNGVFIVGDTGSGKTRLGEHLCELINSQAVHCSSDADHIPVVMVKCPELSTRKQLALQVLAAMGSAHPKKRTYPELLRQIEAIAKPIGLKAIIVDDLQDLLRGRTPKGVQQTAVALRDLYDRLNVTLVLLGTPDSQIVMTGNKQLIKRIPNRQSLPYFDLANKQDVQVFKRLIHEVERWLPLAEKSNLIEATTILRLLKATNGIFQYLLSLLDQSIVEACKDGKESIEMEHLGRAFDWVYGTTFTNGNPFSKEIATLRELDQPGEPFYAWA